MRVSEDFPRSMTDGDFEDAADGTFADEMVANIDRNSCPLQPVDALNHAEWKKAWQFARKRTSEFVKDMFEWGLLRDIEASAQLPLAAPRLGLCGASVPSRKTRSVRTFT